MSDLRTAAQQALEALEADCCGGCDAEYNPCRQRRLAESLRAALAQQAEPLNLRDPAVQKRLASQWGYVPAAQAEPVEPVAWYQKRGQEVFTWPHPACWGQEDKPWTPLYTAPPQRKLVPLTEEEIKTAFHAARNAKLGASQDNSRHRLSVIEIARAVEKASWEKNHGQA